ncbi:enoyl-CoA hydratase/isomerase family protein [Halorubrum amylolyticum]|jgi:enoyl-CoA hydratase|uniref:enoyl-CoA hydratase/isomerase family protein n=1 Tax=Halorubrum amylolyticum TaxID=2508724 RepID=UPI001008F60F|nr:enoyl-CoA hydratase-related protein [Halorubrum amylolyticum]
MINIETDHLTYEVEEYKAYITFNRPDEHNALTPELMDGAIRAIKHADDTDEVRVIIVTGAGEEAFSSGADLAQTIPELGSEARGEESAMEGVDVNDFMFKYDSLTTPIIAAVNGVCIAGGMEFLQATDIRIAEEHARFGLQEPRWGIVPGGGSHVRLPRQIPYAYAMHFLLTGDLFSAEFAHEAGLVSEVVPKGESLDRAEEIADRIIENSPFAVSKIKEIVNRGLEKSPEDAFLFEDRILDEVFAHPHAEEGPKSFFEDEEPSWRADD